MKVSRWIALCGVVALAAVAVTATALGNATPTSQKASIKAALVSEFGTGILAAPPKKGFNLLAWVLPFAGLALAAVLVGGVAWRASRHGRGRASVPADTSLNGHKPLDPEAERRLDEELARFDL